MSRRAKNSRFRNSLGFENYEKWLLVDDFLSQLLGSQVRGGDDHMYKPTIAIANLLFNAPGLDAITYPSVASADRGINICMLPGKADKFFTPFEAWQIRVGDPATHPETGEILRGVKFLYRSRQIRSDGTIEWRQPGDGINPEEVKRFVRRRVQPLPRWPESAK